MNWSLRPGDTFQSGCQVLATVTCFRGDKNGCTLLHGRKWEVVRINLTGAFFHRILQASGKNPYVISPALHQVRSGLVRQNGSWGLKGVLRCFRAHLPQQKCEGKQCQRNRQGQAQEGPENNLYPSHRARHAWITVRLTGYRRVGTSKVAGFASMQQTVKIFTVEALLSHVRLDHCKKRKQQTEQRGRQAKS